MLCSRPDICYSISYFGQFQSCTSDEAYGYLLLVLKYLFSTRFLRLKFKIRKSVSLDGWVDADYGNDINDSKSATGYLFRCFGNSVM